MVDWVQIISFVILITIIVGAVVLFFRKEAKQKERITEYATSLGYRVQDQLIIADKFQITYDLDNPTSTTRYDVQIVMDNPENFQLDIRHKGAFSIELVATSTDDRSSMVMKFEQSPDYQVIKNIFKLSHLYAPKATGYNDQYNIHLKTKFSHKPIIEIIDILSNWN